MWLFFWSFIIIKRNRLQRRQQDECCTSLTVLENDEFIERIQKRPEAFIGTTGLVGLENLLVQTINGLLEFFIEKNQGKIAIQLSRQQISFQVSSTRPLVLNKSKSI